MLTAKQELEYVIESGGGGGSITPHLVDRPDMMVVALLVRKAASAPLLSNSQQQSLKIYFILQQFDSQYQRALVPSKIRHLKKVMGLSGCIGSLH